MARTSEAIASGAEGGDTLLLEGVDDSVEGRAGFVGAVAGEPLHDVEVASGVECLGGDRVAVQVVERDGLENWQSVSSCSHFIGVEHTLKPLAAKSSTRS